MTQGSERLDTRALPNRRLGSVTTSDSCRLARQRPDPTPAQPPGDWPGWLAPQPGVVYGSPRALDSQLNRIVAGIMEARVLVRSGTARRPRARSELRSVGAGKPCSAGVSHSRGPRIDSDSTERARHLRRRRQRYRPRRGGRDRRGRQRVDGDGALLLDAIKAISPRPIRMIVNTSADLDHVGGNAIVGGAGIGLSPDPFGAGNHATVLAHENVLRRLSALAQTNGITVADQDAAERHLHVPLSVLLRQ